MSDLSEAFDLGNQQDVQERNKAIRVTNARVREALRKLLSMTEGQLYLGWLLHESDALMAIDGPPEHGAQFFLGKRAVGIKLLDDARALDRRGRRFLNLLLAGFSAVETHIAQATAKANKTPEGENDGGNDADDA